jgi:hypothetical protein
MEKPKTKLPENTTDRLFDIYDKTAFSMMKRYLVTEGVFCHPGNFNEFKQEFEKFNIDLDYRLIIDDQKMIITRSDKPIIPRHEKIRKAEQRKSQQTATLFRGLIKSDGQRARGSTTTFQLSDSYCDSIDPAMQKGGFKRIILPYNLIEYVINNRLDTNFGDRKDSARCKRAAVIYWFGYGFNREAGRNARAKEFANFCYDYPESIEYLLHNVDPDVVLKFLNYSIAILIKRIIQFQR